MELDHVEAFVAIIRRGGFSRAATTLGGQHLADVFVLDLTRVDTLNPRHRFRVLSDASSGPGARRRSPVMPVTQHLVRADVVRMHERSSLPPTIGIGVTCVQCIGLLILIRYADGRWSSITSKRSSRSSGAAASRARPRPWAASTLLTYSSWI